MFDPKVILVQVVDVILMSLSIWYVAAVAYHLTNGKSYGRRPSAPRNSQKKNILLKVVLLSGILYILSLILHNTILYIPTFTLDPESFNASSTANWSCSDESHICRQRAQCDKWCTYSMNTWWGIFVISESSVYLYFWTRMKLYYYKITEDKKRPIYFTALVYICFVYLVIGHFFTFFNYVRPYDCSKGTCNEVVSESKVTAHFIITSVAILLGHMFILGLIASLIYKQRRECKLPRQSGSASIRVSTSSQLRLRMAVRKLFILTTVCILSDLIFIGIGFTTKNIITRTFRSTFYQMSLLVNMFVVIFTFTNYRSILLPCTVKSRPRAALVRTKC